MTRVLVLMLALLAGAAEAATDTFTASGTWIAPAGVTSVTVATWGAGGGGGGQNQGSDGGGGGGGGAYSSSVVTVVPGNSYTVTVGAGGAGQTGGVGTCGTAGGASWFGSVATVLAAGGAPGCGSTGTPPPGGAGGAAATSVGTARFDGGNGGIGRNSNPSGQGGPGGSSAGTAGVGTSGPDPWTTMIAAPPPAGGGIGGDGGDVGANGNPPAPGSYGGGGGGSGEGVGRVGGAGAGGLVTIAYVLPASVLSINCATACTTNAASVSWTVTFSESVAGVASGNFQLVNSGLGGTPAITGVSGSGTVWTVTASSGTGSGTLRLDMVNNTGVTPALANLPFSGQAFTLDRTAPTVFSIVRVDPTPTSLASVSWTVTFGESVSGVDATDFVLAQGGGVSGALITGVVPVSGTVYTVTASTGTGNGTLGLDLADNDSIVDAVGNPLGGAGAGNGNFTGETYSVNRPVSVTASPTVCVNVAGIGTQAWSTATPNDPLASDNLYATASVDGTVSNFLQCTGYGFAIPVGVTINGITVNVERNSSSTGNGGSNDAAMRIVKAGAIGTADRSTATTYATTDAVEAHGGAADLWGTTWTAADINAANFGAAFAATKANSAGQAHTVSVDHMQITVTYTPSPPTVTSIDIVDTSPVSPNTEVSWTVVFDQSVTGVDAADFSLAEAGGAAGSFITAVTGSGTTWTVTANTGTGETGTLGLNLVDDDTIVNAGSVPLGGTGAGNGNFTGQTYTISAFNHVSISAPASAMALNEVPVTIVPHTVTHGTISGAGTISLSTSTGLGDWSIGTGTGVFVPGAADSGLATYTFGAGESSVALGFTYQTSGTVSLYVANTTTGADMLLYTPVGELANTISFTVSGFVFTSSSCTHNVAIGSPGQCALVSWSPQLAGQDLANVYITSVNTAGVPTRLHASQARTRDMQFGLSCIDPVVHAGRQAAFAAVALPLCEANGASPASWSAVVTATFPGGVPSAGPYVFNYADTGAVNLWMRNSAAVNEVGSSGAFVVKPGGFVLSGIVRSSDSFANPVAADATGSAFVEAGEAFTVSVTATAIDGVTAVPNYGKEVVAESVKLTPVLAGGLGLTNNPAIGGTFGAFANGVATGTAFTWNEVGIITLTPSVADAGYLGAGDVTGTTTGNVGRFSAAQFALSGGVIANRTGLVGCAAPAGCGTFTYMGEQMSAAFNLTARAADGATTLQNYSYSATPANNFARFDPAAAGNPLALAAVDSGTPRTVATLDITTYGAASGSFAGGVASVVAPFAVMRGASASGPFDALEIGIAPVDGDGAALAVLDLAVNAGGAPNTHGRVGSTKARYGRMKLASVHGSELLSLPVAVTAQYWDGATYLTNTLDNDSTFAATDVLLGNYQKNLTAGETGVVTPPAAVTFFDGTANFRLAAPGAGNNGSVDMTVDALSAYLPTSVPARATFGVYKGSNEFIYLRETY